MSEISAVFESLPGFVWRSLADGTLDIANPGMRSYVGPISDELRADWRSCVHPDDRPRIEERASSRPVAGDLVYPPLRIRRFDGVYRWFHCSSREVRDEQGMLVARCGAGWDIHEAVLATEDLRHREAAVRTIVDCIPGFVWQLGSNRELQYLNTKVLDYTGKTLEQLREPGWGDAVHPADVQSFIEQWTYTLQTTCSLVVEFRLRRFDGIYRWFRTTAEPVLDSQDHILGWCGVDIDIDDEKRADQSLRNAHSQLARTAQLAIAAELTASTANAINQPLAAIVANSFACQRWLADSPPAIDRASSILERIVHDCKAAAVIVEGVMGTIRRVPPVNTSQNMNTIIEDVLRILAADLQEQSILIRRTLMAALPAVEVDATLFQQVFVNLIRNSMEAMKDKPVGSRSLHIDSCVRPDGLLFEVGDDGIGYRDEAPLFDAFYTTKPDGLGLGLAIARSIVESYGGRIWAHHREAVGTTVGFSLPLPGAGWRGAPGPSGAGQVNHQGAVMGTPSIFQSLIRMCRWRAQIRAGCATNQGPVHSSR